MSTATALKQHNDMIWQPLCTRADLVENSGVAAWRRGGVAAWRRGGVAAWLETDNGPTQVALFYLPGHSNELYAVDNYDPLGKANVIARGIVDDVKGEPVVASPLYKQHFRLSDGGCLEDADVRLHHWPVRFDGDRLMIAIA